MTSGLFDLAIVNGRIVDPDTGCGPLVNAASVAKVRALVEFLSAAFADASWQRAAVPAGRRRPAVRPARAR